MTGEERLRSCFSPGTEIEAAEYVACVGELIERALYSAQQLCGEIQRQSPQAIQTALLVEQRISLVSEWWNGRKTNT
jgi:hypothetical protein